MGACIVLVERLIEAADEARRTWMQVDVLSGSRRYEMSETVLVDGLKTSISRVAEEIDIVEELVRLDSAKILDLGCGRAQITRAIATGGCSRQVLALEVDELQHAINLGIDDLNNVEFALGGAEQIPAADESFDVVCMFKSLHHVPVASMTRAMDELVRVLRRGGVAYISEPLFKGAFNDCLIPFHDEGLVRREAFAAICAAVESGAMESVSQTFFLAPLHFDDFAQFEQLVIGASHTSHKLSDDVLAQVRVIFEGHAGSQGAEFQQPIRVDLLRRPA
jgi:ubiquinone/menaquinone biosynthesis C-methylase UbiE